MPEISICITTLNRADLLKNFIDSIVSQKQNLDVEIIVSDGGSGDHTREVMESFSKEYSYIKYVNPGRRVGFDEGLHLCVKESTGNFIWGMTDDDYLAQGGLAKVFSQIEPDLDLLLVNVRCFTKDMNIDLKQNLIPISEDRRFSYEEFDNAFSEYIFSLSYVGSFIVKRSIWFENNPEDYYGSWFGTYAAIAESTEVRKIKYLSEPIIHYRSAVSSWTEHTFKIWYDLWPNLVNKFELFSTKVKNDPVILYPWLRVQSLLKSRAMGSYNFSCWFKYIKGSPHASLLFTSFAIFISIIPVFLLNSAVLVAMLVLKRRNLYSIYTMIMSSPFPTISISIGKACGIRF